jgi:hypothetical protein
MVMTDPNNVIGYTAITTSALPGSASNESPVPGTIIFGDWSELLIGSWTGVDILLNPYETTAYAKGRVLVRAMKDLDAQVRHPESLRPRISQWNGAPHRSAPLMGAELLDMAASLMLARRILAASSKSSTPALPSARSPAMQSTDCALSARPRSNARAPVSRHAAVGRGQRGLRYEIDLPDTAVGNDLRELISRGDIKGASVGFRVAAVARRGASRARPPSAVCRQSSCTNLPDSDPRIQRYDRGATKLSRAASGYPAAGPRVPLA